MKLRWNFLVNFFALTLILLLASGIQTSMWFQIFGSIPAPMLWLNIMVYLSLYRKPTLAIFSIYCLGFLLTATTLMPIKMMLFSLLILFSIIYIIKSRVFWSGSGYFTIMCAFSAVTYHFVYFFTSMALEKNMVGFEIADRLIQIILTPLFSVPTYWLLSRLDKIGQDDIMQESGGLNL